MKIPIVLALAASLSACATSGTSDAPRLQRIDAALVRIETGYAAARSLAMLFAPWLPPARVAQLAALADGADRALAAARLATDLATRRTALRRAQAAAAAFRLAAGG